MGWPKGAARKGADASKRGMKTPAEEAEVTCGGCNEEVKTSSASKCMECYGWFCGDCYRTHRC